MRILLLFITVLSCLAFSNEPVELNCRIEPHVRVDVSSSAEGVMGEMLVSKNDTVKKGDILAKLEASLESATVDLRRLQSELESDVDAQTLALDFASRNLDRVKNLYDKKAASFAELDKARTEHKLAEQQLQQAKDRKKQADLEYQRSLADLQRRTVLSPIDGIVVERFKEPGEHIYFEPIVQLVQLDPLRVEVFAPANLFGKIRLNSHAIVTPEIVINKRTYSARVEQVDKIIDGASNTFGVLLSIPNPDYQIPSGLKCKVSFPDIPALQHSLVE